MLVHPPLFHRHRPHHSAPLSAGNTETRRLTSPRAALAESARRTLAAFKRTLARAQRMHTRHCTPSPAHHCARIVMSDHTPSTIATHTRSDAHIAQPPATAPCSDSACVVWSMSNKHSVTGRKWPTAHYPRDEPDSSHSLLFLPVSCIYKLTESSTLSPDSPHFPRHFYVCGVLSTLRLPRLLRPLLLPCQRHRLSHVSLPLAMPQVPHGLPNLPAWPRPCSGMSSVSCLRLVTLLCG